MEESEKTDAKDGVNDIIVFFIICIISGIINGIFVSITRDIIFGWRVVIFGTILAMASILPRVEFW